jgi:hypothetical protein
VDTAAFTLADRQLVLARAHGFESWKRFANISKGLSARILSFRTSNGPPRPS